jgi:hypothetical protein
MDGELKITAKFPEGTVEISQFEDVKNAAARQGVNNGTVNPKRSVAQHLLMPHVCRICKRGVPPEARTLRGGGPRLASFET